MNRIEVIGWSEESYKIRKDFSTISDF